MAVLLVNRGRLSRRTVVGVGMLVALAGLEDYFQTSLLMGLIPATLLEAVVVVVLPALLEEPAVVALAVITVQELPVQPILVEAVEVVRKLLVALVDQV